MNSDEVFSILAKIDAKLFGKDAEIIENRAKRIDVPRSDLYEAERKLEKTRKICLAVEIFLAHDGLISDAQIEALLRKACSDYPIIPFISRSSVDRYLKDESIIRIYGEKTYRFILEQRLANLMAAKSKGGTAYAQNNDPIKDEIGRFQGSTRK